MKFAHATYQYESWLRGHIQLIEADLLHKHELMRDAVFPFLRATFYRWAQTFVVLCPAEMKAPRVLGVGDLHVENFGTWRDAEGRLVWGLNDFDEACRLPYTCDLVRMATSARFAIESDHLSIDPERAITALLEGYADSLDAGGNPLVLSEHHRALRQIAVERLKSPELFWQKLNALPALDEKIPSSARKAIESQLPARDLEYRVVHRVSGLGSLGRRRYVAIAEWRGGKIAREAKELAPSAWGWARDAADEPIAYDEILNRAIRCRDPFVGLRGTWLVRRLAPDCSRIELNSLPAKHDAVRLLHAMGWETANVHLGSAKAAVLLADMRQRGKRWLHRAAAIMYDSVMDDWQHWRKKSTQQENGDSAEA